MVPGSGPPACLQHDGTRVPQKRRARGPSNADATALPPRNEVPHPQQGIQEREEATH